MEGEKIGMHRIDAEHWNRRATYEWFKTFSNPCYGVGVDMDVTALVPFAKSRGWSFFPCMAYILTTAMNTVEEMRMRIVDGEPVIYDKITPAYTVMTEAGMFVNVRQGLGGSMAEFCAASRNLIDTAKAGMTAAPDGMYNSENSWSEYYLTSVPWLSLDHMSHPIPDDKSSQSVPRVCFDKYREENGRYKVKLNITVSHTLVDGYPLCRTFSKIQECFDRCAELYG